MRGQFAKRLCAYRNAALSRRTVFQRSYLPRISSMTEGENLLFGDGDYRKVRTIFFLLTGTTFLSFSLKGKIITLDSAPISSDDTESDDDKTTIVNWSGTHSVNLNDRDYHEPETIEELEEIVAKCHKNGQCIRPVGSALSPNGVSFNPAGMLSLANLDSIIKVDKNNMSVTVQAGARVSQVIDELRDHELTLPNLASIAEQQMGGFIQIGAHGTGAKIPPVDDFVTSLKLVTPSQGTVTLTEADGDLFHLAKVGLGCLGIVSEITMKCIPTHNLLEHTYVLTRKEAKEQLNALLKKHKHVRYMWIPYEDAVIVVTNDPEDESCVEVVEEIEASQTSSERFKPLKDLIMELTNTSTEPYTEEMLDGKSFGALRDILIGMNPLDVDHIKRVNMAEAEFWKKSEGYSLKPSDELLQFDCGGQQWVYEVCCETGTYNENNGNDIKLMEDILSKIESEKIPAHPPIEQRWTASSRSSMSPAHGEKGRLFTWVGIIMYLPDEGEEIRKRITEAFQGRYCDLVKEVGGNQIVSHWGKVEIPTKVSDVDRLKTMMSRRYPVEKFNGARFRFDPNNICSNKLINSLLGTPNAGKSG